MNSRKIFIAGIVRGIGDTIIKDWSTFLNSLYDRKITKRKI